jgi:ABC-type nitrate/sulfonate/bicarbonate transport system substrate-binding protein
VTVGTSAAIAPFLAAKHAGFFEKHGVQLDHQITGVGTAATQTLLSGDVDISMAAPDVAIASRATGGDLRIMASIALRPIWHLVSLPQIANLEDLRGQTIMTTGVGVDYLLKKVLADSTGMQSGLDYDKLHGPASSMVAGLKAGSLAAGGLTPPTECQMFAEGFRPLLYFADRVPYYHAGTVTASANWARANREQMVRYLMALREAERWVKDPANKSAMIQIFMDEIKTEPRYAEQTYDILLTRGHFPDGLMPVREAVDTVVAGLVSEGVVPPPGPTMEDLFELDYLREATTRLGGS